MKFKVKPYIQSGDKRTRKKFCLFPIRYENVVYWLETVELIEEFEHGDGDSFWAIIKVKSL